MKKKILASLSLLACLFVLAGCSQVSLTNTGAQPGAPLEGGTPPEGMPADGGITPEGGMPTNSGSTPPPDDIIVPSGALLME